MNTIKSSRFIFIATRPYFRRTIFLPAILLVVLISTALTSTNSATNAGIYLFFTLFMLSYLLVSYAFYVWDKVPQLFSALPQRRVDFVRGVYLNYLVLVAIDLVIGLIVYLLVNLSGASDLGFLFSLGLIFFIFVLIMAIELPIAFKIGYARMQMVFAFAVVVVGLAPTLITQVFHGGSLILWGLSHIALFDNPLLFLVLIMVALVGLAGSYRVSAQIYQNKDM